MEAEKLVAAFGRDPRSCLPLLGFIDRSFSSASRWVRRSRPRPIVGSDAGFSFSAAHPLPPSRLGFSQKKRKGGIWTCYGGAHRENKLLFCSQLGVCRSHRGRSQNAACKGGVPTHVVAHAHTRTYVTSSTGEHCFRKPTNAWSGHSRL